VRLTDLRPGPGARTPRKRVGRGHGSGHVKTSGRGQKGQKARTGSGIPAYFEGGQNRFSQRMPYLGGFKNPFRKEYIIVNIADLNRVFAAGETVNGETLAAKGLIRPSHSKRLIKVLGVGKVNRALTVSAHKVSEKARARIEGAGGSVALIEMRTPQKTKRARDKETNSPAAGSSPA